MHSCIRIASLLKARHPDSLRKCSVIRAPTGTAGSPPAIERVPRRKGAPFQVTSSEAVPSAPSLETSRRSVTEPTRSASARAASAIRGSSGRTRGERGVSPRVANTRNLAEIRDRKGMRGRPQEASGAHGAAALPYRGAYTR